MPGLTNIVIALAVIGIGVAHNFILHSDRFSFAQQITIFLVSYFVFFIGLMIFFKIKDIRAANKGE